MAGGHIGGTMLGVLVGALLAGALAQQGDATMQPGPLLKQQKLVRGPSDALGAGEADYVRRRKEVVVEALGRLDINCTADSVPHIAVLGSGGGQRAAVSLLGSLHQMGKDDLLDTVLYLGGVSGSCWAMASLYSDPQWSINMDQALSKLTSDPPGKLDAVDWLVRRSSEDNFSLSDVWGLLTSFLFMNHLEKRHMSKEADRNATNPYPVYSAIEKTCYINDTAEALWFEITPHEAGFTDLGLFVPTTHLGSSFQGGELQNHKPEMDLLRLQGIVSSALAHHDSYQSMLPAWLKIPHAGHEANELLGVHYMLFGLLELLESDVRDINDTAGMKALKEHILDKLQTEAPVVQDVSEEKVKLLRQKNAELISTIETWCYNQSIFNFEGSPRISHFVKLLLEQDIQGSSVNMTLTEATTTCGLIAKLIPLVKDWQWGTTGNFIYQLNDTQLPSCLASEQLNLMDSGLSINVPYASFLGEKRDVDLIIAPEFSAGDMFETLTLARDYAARVGKPFPRIPDTVLEEKDWPEDFYVFPGEHGQPTILFMPLFNRKNCKDRAEVEARMSEYSTFHRPFSNEKMAELLEIAGANMKNNKDAIVKEIRNAALSRHTRM